MIATKPHMAGVQAPMPARPPLDGDDGQEDDRTDGHPRSRAASGADPRQQPPGKDGLAGPQERGREDEQLADAEARAGRRVEQQRAAKQHDEGQQRGGAGPLAEEWPGGDRDPQEERLLEHGRARRGSQGQALEEEGEGEAAADDAEDEEADQLTTAERRRPVATWSRSAWRPTSPNARTGRRGR